MNKKAYIFTLDAIIAIIILSIAAVLLLTQLPSQQTDYLLDHAGQDVINVLSHTQTTDLCNTQEEDCDCPNHPRLTELTCDESIEDKNTSILELIGAHLVQGGTPPQQINNTIHELIRETNLVDERFGFSLLYTAPGNDEPIELHVST